MFYWVLFWFPNITLPRIKEPIVDNIPALFGAGGWLFDESADVACYAPFDAGV